jgi:hypothetical protein
MLKKVLHVIPAISLAVAMLAAHPVAAAANPASVVATINGGGTAFMTSGPTAGGKGISSFGIHATLFSDGSAQGHVTCVDQMGDTMAGNAFGEVTSWRNADGSLSLDGALTLFITGKVVLIPGGPHFALDFTVTVQHFGGAGVGHWTLEAGGETICIELLVSGQLVMRRN